MNLIENALNITQSSSVGKAETTTVMALLDSSTRDDILSGATKVIENPGIIPNTTTTVTIAPDLVPDDSWGFILVPLLALFCILLLSAMVFFMARNRRGLAHIYCKRKVVPNFTYEDSDSAMEQGDDYDFDDPTECLLKGKLQIDNSYEGYRTTQVTRGTVGKNELYT